MAPRWCHDSADMRQSQAMNRHVVLVLSVTWVRFGILAQFAHLWALPLFFFASNIARVGLNGVNNVIGKIFVLSTFFINAVA